MVEEPGRLGAGGAVGLHLPEGRLDLRSELLERGVARRLAEVTHRIHTVGRCTGNGSGGSDAARIEADDVEGSLYTGEGRLRSTLDVLNPGPTGAAGVDEEAALTHRTGGQVLLHRDLNGLTIRLGVVQRHLHLRTLEPGPLRRPLHPTGRTAVVPLHLLAVERLQPLGHHSLRSHSRSRHRHRGNRTGTHTQTHTRHSGQHPSNHPTTPRSPCGSTASATVHYRRNDAVLTTTLSCSRFHGHHRIK